MFVSPHALTSRVVWHVTEKGWSSDFPPLLSAFSGKYPMAWFSENKAECIRALSSANAIERSSMAFMLRSHNGVHCCGTVGDSHSSSQLIAAKRTFTGDSFQNHDAKVRISEQNTKFYLRIFCRSATRSSSARLLPAGRKKETHPLQAKRRKRRAARARI